MAKNHVFNGVTGNQFLINPLFAKEAHKDRN